MKKNSAVILITLAAGLSIFAAIAFNAQQIKAAQAKPLIKTEEIYPDVETVLAKPDTYQAQIKAWGEAQAEHRLTLKADVMGRIKKLSTGFKTGKTVKKGDILLEIDPTDYQKALADAKAQMADAQLALFEEQRQSQQALEEWQQSGLEGEPDSPLVLRKPQLAKAEAVLAQAEAAVAKAKRDLALTQIRAPFDSFVVSRMVQPGGYVQQGTELAELYSTDKLEVSVGLSDYQWQNIQTAGINNDPTILLSRADVQHAWPADFDRVELHTNSDSRQRALIVSVHAPLQQHPALHPGDFFEVTIEGRKLDDIWQLPASAISQQGTVWVVTDEGTLKAHPSKVIYQKDNYVYVRPPASLDSTVAQVVIRPLSSYLDGMHVNPVTGASHD